MAQIVKATDYNLNLCKQALVNSQVIAVPTETVYGLAGNALDEIALHAIFKIKGRPLYNPLILLSIHFTVSDLLPFSILLDYFLPNYAQRRPL